LVDHSISASIPPKSEPEAVPSSPQVLTDGAGASAAVPRGSPQAQSGASNRSPSKGVFCAETDFFSGWCNGFAFEWSELGPILTN
jgi:hypothetical protein